jgi:polysaccharide pyruvyl transferase WcaK-like protein
MASLVGELNSKGLAVVLLASSRVEEQGQDDLEVGRQVVAQAKQQGASDVVVQETRSLDEFIVALEGLRAVVGTRLHACILAIAYGKPAVAIGYQPKSEGTYRLLGLEKYSHDVETFDPVRVAALIGDAIDDPAAFATAGSDARTAVLAYYLRRCTGIMRTQGGGPL